MSAVSLKRRLRVKKMENTYEPRVWMVEMFNTATGRWEATVGASLWRYDARAERRRWHENNPDDTFRIRCYTPAKARQ